MTGFDLGKALDFIRLNDANRVLRESGKQTEMDREALLLSARALAASKKDA